MNQKTILTIDQGTTGTTVTLFSCTTEQGQSPMALAQASFDFEQHFPAPGQVEHHLDQIWDSIEKGIKEVGQHPLFSSVSCIGITNQRETICFWHRQTGEPLAPAIVWQDRRSQRICEDLKTDPTHKEAFFQSRTGLLLDPYFSGTKVAWAIQNWPTVKTAYEAGNLKVGTIDSYILSKLTDHLVHATEPSNASRTLAYNIITETFDKNLIEALGIGNSNNQQLAYAIWPEVKPSFCEFGKTKNLGFIRDGIPITGILGDQQSALLGQACIEPGMAKCTYGTGAFLLMNIGTEPTISKHRLLTTIAWKFKDQKPVYALEGSAFVAGAAVQWLRDGLQIIKNAAEIEALANTVASSEGVVFVPALTGLGAPHWNAGATGMLTGLTRGTKKGHIARAALEGIAFQNADLLTAMSSESSSNNSLKVLRVDGGAAANNLLMQIQANYLGIRLERPIDLESTSLGAAFAAGLGYGIWPNLQSVSSNWKCDQKFEPKISPEIRKIEMNRWNTALKRVLL